MIGSGRAPGPTLAVSTLAGKGHVRNLVAGDQEQR
jgi:hypothetical protein